MKQILIRLDDETFEVLEKRRGLVSKNAFIAGLIKPKKNWEFGESEIKGTITEVSGDTVKVTVDKYAEAKEFCEKVGKITYEIDYSKSVELSKEAAGIAKRAGLEIQGNWFYDPKTEKYVCKWVAGR